MEYRYKINPNLPNLDVVLEDIGIRIFPNKLYNLDARCDGDAQKASGELRSSIRQNWIHRVEFEEPKPRKIKSAPIPKVEAPPKPTEEEIKATKVFDTAVAMGIIQPTDKGFECPNVKGKRNFILKNKDRAIKRMTTEPKLMAHIQKLCQG